MAPKLGTPHSFEDAVGTELSNKYDYLNNVHYGLARIAVEELTNPPVVDLRSGQQAESNEAIVRRNVTTSYRERLGHMALAVLARVEQPLIDQLGYEPAHFVGAARHIGNLVVADTSQKRANTLNNLFAQNPIREQLAGMRITGLARLRTYDSPLNILVRERVSDVPLGAEVNFYGAHVAAPIFNVWFDVAAIGAEDMDDPMAAIRHALDTTVKNATEESMDAENMALQTAREALINKLSR
jgi:hypothetical protein